MRKQFKFLLVMPFVFSIVSCGIYRPQLTWPAQLIATEGIEGETQSKIHTDIESLNAKLGTTLLDLTPGKGSPVSIKAVADFAQTRSVAGKQIDTAYVGPSGARGLLGARIAGRATLTSEGCTIELGTFLFDPSTKDLLLSVLWHEIGHCTGLLHVVEENELMSPLTLPFSKYNDEKLNRFVAAILASIK